MVAENSSGNDGSSLVRAPTRAAFSFADPDRAVILPIRLADPTRRAILDRLAAGEATVGHLSRPFPLSLAAVSKHLGVLERAGLVTREARGRERVCRINPAALEDARAWLQFHERFWTDRLGALDALVGTGSGKSEESP